jgi:hypothetical protein
VSTSAALPVSVRITGKAALVVLTVCEGNVKVVGETLATGFEFAAPIPLTVTVCGLPLALSATSNRAVRGPTPEGLKVTDNVQLFAAAKLLPQVFVSEKSAAFVPDKET